MRCLDQLQLVTKGQGGPMCGRQGARCLLHRRSHWVGARCHPPATAGQGVGSGPQAGPCLSCPRRARPARGRRHCHARNSPACRSRSGREMLAQVTGGAARAGPGPERDEHPAVTQASSARPVHCSVAGPGRGGRRPRSVRGGAEAEAGAGAAPGPHPSYGNSFLKVTFSPTARPARTRKCRAPPEVTPSASARPCGRGGSRGGAGGGHREERGWSAAWRGRGGAVLGS